MTNSLQRLGEIYSYYLDERHLDDLDITFVEWLSSSMYASEVGDIASACFSKCQQNFSTQESLPSNNLMTLSLSERKQLFFRLVESYATLKTIREGRASIVPVLVISDAVRLVDIETVPIDEDGGYNTAVRAFVDYDMQNPRFDENRVLPPSWLRT